MSVLVHLCVPGYCVARTAPVHLQTGSLVHWFQAGSCAIPCVHVTDRGHLFVSTVDNTIACFSLKVCMWFEIHCWIHLFTLLCVCTGLQNSGSTADAPPRLPTHCTTQSCEHHSTSTSNTGLLLIVGSLEQPTTAQTQCNVSLPPLLPF